MSMGRKHVNLMNQSDEDARDLAELGVGLKSDFRHGGVSKCDKMCDEFSPAVDDLSTCLRHLGRV